MLSSGTQESVLDGSLDFYKLPYLIKNGLERSGNSIILSTFKRSLSPSVLKKNYPRELEYFSILGMHSSVMPLRSCPLMVGGQKVGSRTFDG